MNNLIEFSSPAFWAIGWAVIHTSWQAIVVMIGLRVMLRFISNQYAILRYWLSIVGLLVIMTWSGATFMKYYNPQVTNNIVEMNTSYSPILSTIADTETEPNTLIKMPKAVLESVDFHQWIPNITFLWMIGVILFSFWLIHGYYRLLFFRKSGIIATPDQIQTQFLILCERVQVKRRVSLLISTIVKGPITFGIIKPYIVLPIEILTTLSEEEIKVLLLHELAHIKRYDYVVNFIQSLIEVLLFFHPAVWWINRQIRQEREHCCDDFVLKHIKNPMLYAEALTNVETSFLSLKTSLVMSANQKNGQFSKRIYRLFGHYESSSFSLKGVFVALIMVSVLMIQNIHAQRSVEEIEPIKIESNVDLNITTVIAHSEGTKTQPVAMEYTQQLQEEYQLSETIVEPIPIRTETPVVSDKCYAEALFKGERKAYYDNFYIYTGNPKTATIELEKRDFITEIKKHVWCKVPKEEPCTSQNPDDCFEWKLQPMKDKVETVYIVKDTTQTTEFKMQRFRYYENRTGGMKKVEILCDHKVTPEIVQQIYQKLTAEGMPTGEYDGSITGALQDCITVYQSLNDMPMGQLDLAFLNALGINY